MYSSRSSVAVMHAPMCHAPKSDPGESSVDRHWYSVDRRRTAASHKFLHGGLVYHCIMCPCEGICIPGLYPVVHRKYVRSRVCMRMSIQFDLANRERATCTRPSRWLHQDHGTASSVAGGQHARPHIRQTHSHTVPRSRWILH